jgi:hypothetical protein
MSEHDHEDERGVAPARHIVTIHTAGGHRIVLDDRAGTISITHKSGSAVTLTDSGVDVRATVQVTVNAQMVRVDAAMAEFSGVVQCNTLITNSVVSASYTPGAGNIS